MGSIATKLKIFIIFMIFLMITLGFIAVDYMLSHRSTDSEIQMRSCLYAQTIVPAHYPAIIKGTAIGQGLILSSSCPNQACLNDACGPFRKCQTVS